MNIDNLKAWTTRLRDPEMIGRQTNGTLTRAGDDGTLTHCCLGVGCVVAGVPVRVVDHENDDPDIDNEKATYFYYGEAGAEDLPPREFFEWLGLIADGEWGKITGAESDLQLDWPPCRAWSGAVHANPDSWRDRDGYAFRDDPAYTCAGLNDTVGMTFAQIADVVDYFGVRL